MGDVEQQAEVAGRAPRVPYVCHGSCQADVAHPLTPNAGVGYFHSTFLTYDAFVADLLVLPAVALPVSGRAEDGLAEEPVFLRAQATVVDGLRLRDLAVRPLADLFRGGQTNTDRLDIIDFQVLSLLHLPLRRLGSGSAHLGPVRKRVGSSTGRPLVPGRATHLAHRSQRSPQTESTRDCD